MTKKWTHTKAFAHFGTTPRNIQWSWSAKNEKTGTVVVTLWQDLFKKQGYEFVATDRSAPGFKELVENLTWAREHCDGRINVIIAIAKDKNANTRSIAECFPSNMVMKLVEFNADAGAFRFEAA